MWPKKLMVARGGLVDKLSPHGIHKRIRCRFDETMAKNL